MSSWLVRLATRLAAAEESSEHDPASDASPPDHGAIARAVFVGEDYGAAEKLLWEIVRDKPNSPNATYLLGLTLLFQGRYDDAKPLIERAYQLRLWIDDEIVGARSREVLEASAERFPSWEWPKYQLARQRWHSIGLALPAVIQHYCTTLERPPSFVQIGANDGRRGDPLHKLIRAHEMTGLLVEPQDVPFEQLKSNYADVEGLLFERAAIVENDEPVTMFTSVKRTTIGTLDRQRNILRNVDEFSEIIVPGLRFDSLLEKHDVRSFDVLQIDTEGHDYNVLRQVDLEKRKVQIVNLELYCMPVSERLEVFRMLDEARFATSFDGMNLLAVRRDTFKERFCIVDSDPE